MSYSPNFRGTASTAPSSSNATTFQNGTGSTMPIGTSVSSNTSGQMVLTDVTSESSIEAWLGITTQSTPTTASGLVASDGRVQNIPLSLGFSVGDPIWVSTTAGQLTNVKPTIGTGGFVENDFVLFVGVVVQNEFNPSNQDIQLCRQIIGEL